MNDEHRQAVRQYRNAVDQQERDDREKIADAHVADLVENKRLYDIAEAEREHKRMMKGLK